MDKKQVGKVVEEVVKHLPGRHDQGTHGKGTGQSDRFVPSKDEFDSGASYRQVSLPKVDVDKGVEADYLGSQQRKIRDVTALKDYVERLAIKTIKKTGIGGDVTKIRRYATEGGERAEIVIDGKSIRLFKSPDGWRKS